MTHANWTDAELDRALDALRQAEAAALSPSRVGVAVMAAWDAAHLSPRAPKRAWYRLGALAAAATVALALGSLSRALDRSIGPRSHQESGRTVVLVGGPILQDEPVRLVRMRLPTATLAALGIRSAAAEPREHLDVDVIIGEDGIARAIQLGM